MASTSTINAWTDDLASSLLPISPTKRHRQSSRRSINNFHRRLKHHNFARTNQFDVRDRLDGLEEKFQILNRDDLSDALHKRTTELHQHHERWIPDVLDLLLRLSDNPIQKTKIADLSDIVHSAEAPTPLKWADIEADDPIDRHDLIWRIPSFSDLSSEDGDTEISTTTTSPASAKKRGPKIEGPVDVPHGSKVFHEFDLNAAQAQLQTLCRAEMIPGDTVTEIQLLRQILLIVQGFPSILFQRDGERFQLNINLKFLNISRQTVQAFVSRIWPVVNGLRSIQAWLEQSTTIDYVQTIKESIETIMRNFRSSICALEEQMLYPSSIQVASLLSMMMQIEQRSSSIINLTGLVEQAKLADPVSCLDALYQAVCEFYFVNNEAGLEVVLPMFLRAFEVYMKPVNGWLDHGMCMPELQPFFVRSKGYTISTNSLWHDWFELNLDGRFRPPRFLQEHCQCIFSCGKTVAFINHISRSQTEDNSKLDNEETLQNKIQALVSDRAIPFPAALSNVLSSYLSALLATKTIVLRQLLYTSCGLTRTFNAFEHLYLRKNGALLDIIETRIFNRIDTCKDNWNDRFLIADMLGDAYINDPSIDLSSVTVLSAPSSSRSPENLRRSVRILSGLAIDYTLPWPVANIIPKPSMAAYRRISLHLIQIRRAKYVLDRIAYCHAHSTPISNNPRNQLLAQATTFMLLQFTNTLYDYFTTGVVLPLTERMRQDFQVARDVDAMIAVHANYITSMEYACLTAKQLKVLREALIGLLDMCIRFADLLVSSSDADAGPANRVRNGSEDFEAASFFSARSQWKRRRRRHGMDLDEEDEDEDEDEIGDDGEGYSSFVVLEQNTTVVQEIGKLQVHFKRQLGFFIAGLRGVGRGSGSAVVDGFEMLADRLDWKGSGVSISA